MPSRRLHALAAAAAAVLSGCGSSSSPPPTSSSFADAKPLRPPAKHHRAKSRRRRPDTGARIGATQRVNAATTTLDVTIKRLIDPLRYSGASLPPKTHAVGVLVEIRNIGSGLYDSSATGDVSVVPSTGPAPPVFAPSGTCQTQLRDFDNYITAGVVRDGCVVFAVGNSARVKAVLFSPHAQRRGRASWSVGR